MIGIFSLLSSPLGKYLAVAGGVVVFIASLWGALLIRDAGVRRQAIERFEKQQLEIVIKRQEDFNRQTRILQETQTRIIEGLNKKIEETDRKTIEVESYLNSSDARKNDRDASDILRETLKRLGAPK